MTMPFHGQWDPPVDEVLFRNYFPELRGGFFVECGAGNGVIENNCLFFENERGWTGVNVEPSGPAFAQLVKNRPGSVNLNVALGDRNGKATFTEAIKDGYGGGCLVWHPKFKAEVAAEGYAFIDREVEVATYKSLLRNPRIRHVDLFVLDVDGHELKVIDGMHPLHVPGVMCVEYPLVGLEPLKEKMSALGHRFDFVSFNNAYFSLPGRIPAKAGGWFGATDTYPY